MLLCNENAGATQPGDAERLAEAVRAAGATEIAMVDVDEIETLFRRAAHANLVVVLGGDGTARAAASLAKPDSPPLVLLPGGTLNMLPKVLYGDLPWPDALEAALERGVVKRMTGGKANGEPFFIAAMFGAPALLARAREAIRKGKLISAARRLRHYAGRAFTRRLIGRPDGARMKSSEAFGVLCPSFSGGIEGVDLEWVRLDARGMGDLARVGMAALGPNWRDDPVIEARRCGSGEIRGRGAIPATLDGEPCTFLSRVRIVYHGEGPRVVALEPEPAEA
ncbi:MAG: diacylglycerol kinase family protein [Hyphomonadaceae bacterium]